MHYPVFYFRQAATILLLILGIRASAQFDLEFQGNVTDTSGQIFSEVNLQVFDREGNLVRYIDTDTSGTYQFKLSTMIPDRYTIAVSRKGYVTKKFVVSTENIPPKQRGTKFPLIEADISLFRRMYGVDYSALETPMMIYYYDVAKDSYVYDQQHLARMRLVLEEIREQEKRQRR